jgi:hypothetical protein
MGIGAPRSSNSANYYSPASPGISNVGSYQVSGYPYLTGTNGLANGQEELVSFPGVTRAIEVRNLTPDTHLKIHFASNGGGTANTLKGHHYMTLSGSSVTGSQSVRRLEVKCNELYITNDCGNPLTYEVFAEITGIGVAEMFTLSGSGINA